MSGGSENVVEVQMELLSVMSFLNLFIEVIEQML
jgi:hypothetical protein